MTNDSPAFEPELTLESAILQAIDARIEQVWTALPGRITSWDSTKQRATIEVTVTDPDGANLPPISDVRVVQPLAGGVGLALPVASGVSGLLLICTLEPANWFLRGVSGGTPSSQKRHQLGYSVFLPGVGSDTPAAPAQPVLGNLLHTAHNMALGDNVASVLSFLHTQISTLTPGPSEPGLAAFKAAWTGHFPAGLPTLDTSDAKVTR